MPARVWFSSLLPTPWPQLQDYDLVLSVELQGASVDPPAVLDLHPFTVLFILGFPPRQSAC
eukprot:COSAG02_NODE_7828_length_2831_cov_1.731698_2_plen_61_part_00